MARQPGALLGLMESLSDPTRLRLLRLLDRHELGVAELVLVLRLPQSTVSRHLKVLSEQGWVTSRPVKTTNLYKMAPGKAVPRRLWDLAREEMKGWATLRQDELRLERFLASRQPSTEAFFSGAAGHWDRLRAEFYGRTFSTTALLGLIDPGLVVADLGCGTGETAAALAPHVRKVIGVDQSEAMLRAAQRRTSHLQTVDLRRGRLESLPIEDGACDGALLILALSYVAEPDVVVGEARRILRPGGRAVVVDLLRHDQEEFRERMGQQRLGWEPEELQRIMEEKGFVGIACGPLPPEPEAKGPALILAVGSAGKREEEQE